MTKPTVCRSLIFLFLLFGSALPAGAGDKEDVEAALKIWTENLAVGTTENPDKILSLYAKDAVLWGTISSTRRDDPVAIRDYFGNAYTNLPKLTVTFQAPYIRVYGNVAINTGSYTFSYVKDAEIKTLPARYSFSYVKRNGRWLIVDHHSSGMPKPAK